MHLTAVLLLCCGWVPALPSSPAEVAVAGLQDQAARPLRHDEKIVVTADRSADNVRNVGASVSIITGDEIRASGARWLIDVLQLAAGVNVVRSGPPGSLTQVLIRGADAGHTLFLIDGVKVNSPTTGSYDLSGLQLAADQIDRIEVVRGPQSALYGSQAIGGVINVITRRGAAPATWGFEAEGGAYSTGRAHSWAHGAARQLTYSGSLTYFDSSGFSSASERNGNVEADGYRNVSFSGRLDYGADSGAVARAFVRGFDSELDTDGFDFAVGPIDNIANVQTSREIYVGVGAGWAAPRFSSFVEFSAAESDLETLTPEDFFTGFLLDSSVREVDWQSEAALPGGHALTGGLEYRREQAVSVSSTAFGDDGFEEKVDVVGLYVHDRVRIRDRATLTGGVRYEDHSAFGGKWTGRATATVEASSIVRVHGSAGTGFQAPTLNDLYFPGFSNPDLRPEESTGFDLGVEAFVVAPQTRLDVTFFHNDIRRLIEFDFVSSRPENIGNATTAGVEIEGDWSPGAGLTVAGDYTLTRARADGSDDQLIRRPRHQGGMRVFGTLRPGLRLWAEVRGRGRRFDNGAAGRQELDAYAVVNLAADYEVADGIVMRGRIDNLFDTAYEEVIGFGTAGAGAYVGVTLTLPRR